MQSMRSLLRTVCVVTVAAVAVRAANIFLHNPRGSQGRLADNNEAVTQTNRLFYSGSRFSFKRDMSDSEYPSEGGVNSGGPNGALYYFVGSVLPIEFTVTGGCGSDQPGGGKASSHCDIIIQYMCSDTVRDGIENTRIPLNPDGEAERSTNSYKYGMHENYMYFQMCNTRPRNLGLFVGDRTFDTNQNSARFTRQNPGGVQYGFECAEEREYYPYWAPTPWRDIAILTDTTKRCEYYKAESQNVKPSCYCKTPNKLLQSDCPSVNWTCIDAWQTAAPECLEAPWVHEHMSSNGLSGYPLYYNWTVPDTAANSCALRVRYNLTSGEVGPSAWPAGLGATDLFDDGKAGWLNSDYNGVGVSPFEPHKMVQMCSAPSEFPAASELCHLMLNQYSELQPSRVYEDRSHRFAILPRPASIANRIHNLNVRGKRGNIVQTFPSVEYDFVPNVLHCKQGEWIHVQWTGSDNNRNNVDGEGLDQTDRSNMVQLRNFKTNFPIATTDQNLFFSDSAVGLAYAGLNARESLCKTYAQIQATNQNDNDREQDTANCGKLNPGTPYFDGGLQRCQNPGVFFYMSSRNNNFSNRSQKGVIVVEPCDGADTCSNADSLPVNADGFYDPYGSASAASTLSVTVLATLSSLVVVAFTLLL